jgi:hypothetical protein
MLNVDIVVARDSASDRLSRIRLIDLDLTLFPN